MRGLLQDPRGQNRSCCPQTPAFSSTSSGCRSLSDQDQCAGPPENIDDDDDVNVPDDEKEEEDEEKKEKDEKEDIHRELWRKGGGE